MGVRSLRERGGRNFIKGDLSSRENMDYVTWLIQRARGGGGGGGAVRPGPIQRVQGGCYPPLANSTSGGGGGGGCCPTWLVQRVGGGGGGAVRVKLHGTSGHWGLGDCDTVLYSCEHTNAY